MRAGAMSAVAQRLPSCASTAIKPSPTRLQVPKPRAQAIDLEHTPQQIISAVILHTCRMPDPQWPRFDLAHIWGGPFSRAGSPATHGCRLLHTKLAVSSV